MVTDVFLGSLLLPTLPSLGCETDVGKQTIGQLRRARMSIQRTWRSTQTLSLASRFTTAKWGINLQSTQQETARVAYMEKPTTPTQIDRRSTTVEPSVGGDLTLCDVGRGHFSQHVHDNVLLSDGASYNSAAACRFAKITECGSEEAEKEAMRGPDQAADEAIWKTPVSMLPWYGWRL
jgi:hypothetical protein